MITFTHDGKSISLAPSMIFLSGLFAVTKEKNATDEDIQNGDKSNYSKDYKCQILKIDGILHSLDETKSATSKLNIPHGSPGGNNRHDNTL